MLFPLLVFLCAYSIHAAASALASSRNSSTAFILLFDFFGFAQLRYQFVERQAYTLQMNLQHYGLYIISKYQAQRSLRSWLIGLSTIVNWLIATWEFSQLSQLNSCTFPCWVTVSRADHSAVHHSVCVMPATGSTCQWASHCPVAQRDNDFATIWLPLPPVCQPFAISLQPSLSLSLSFMPSLAWPHSFSSSFRRRRCCRRCRSQNVRKNRNENFWLPASEEGKSKANKANKANKTNTRSHLGD